MQSEISKKIDEARRAIEKGNAEAIRAIRAGDRTALAAAAAREFRDTQRHRELLRSHDEIRQEQVRIRESLDAGLGRLAAIALEQTVLLNRIATATESPRTTQAAELRRMALTHLDAGVPGEARALLEESLALDGTVHAGYLSLAFVLFKLGEHDAAVETLERSLPYAPLHIETDVGLPKGRASRSCRAYVHHVSARIRAHQERYGEAARLLMQAIDADGTAAPSAHYELAVYFMKAGDPAGAAAAFQSVVLLSPRLAMFALDDEDLAPIRGLMIDQVQAKERERREEARKRSAWFAERLEGARPAAEATAAARTGFDRTAEPGPAEQAFSEAERAFEVHGATVEDPEILLLPVAKLDVACHDALRRVEEADFAAERATWKKLAGKRRLRRLAVLGGIVLAGLVGFAAWPEPPVAPAALAEGAVPRTDTQVGRWVARMVFATNLEGEADAELRAEREAGQVGGLMAAMQDPFGNAPAAPLGVMVEFDERLEREAGRRERLEEFRDWGWREARITREELYREVRDKDAPVDDGTMRWLRDLSARLRELAAMEGTTPPAAEVLTEYARSVDELAHELDGAGPAGE